MVDPGKYDQALQALHRVLIHTRAMGYEGCDPQKIASLLDWAEHLPLHLGAPQDRTAEFRSVLADLAEQEPRFRAAVAAFDEPVPVRTWPTCGTTRGTAAPVRLILTAPQPGLDKVGLTKSLQHALQLPLAQAKGLTDRVAAGEAVVLPVPSRTVAEQFVAPGTAVGATVIVEDVSGRRG